MLHFIGCGSAFHTELGNNGAFIKKDDTLFLIDCGSCTFERLQKSGLLEGVEQINVLLTHTHPDHVGSLGDLIFYGYYMIGKLAEPTVTVFSPFDLYIKELLKGMGVKENNYNLVEFTDRAEVKEENFHIEWEAVAVSHVKELNCYGYVLRVDQTLIYYSGDCSDIPTDILEKKRNGAFDFFYQDTSKADFEGNPHLSLNKLSQLVKEGARGNVYCMHLDKGFNREEAEQLGFKVVSSFMK